MCSGLIDALRVSKVLPQLQVTWIVSYLGCVPVFMVSFRRGAPVVPGAALRPPRGSPADPRPCAGQSIIIARKLPLGKVAPPSLGLRGSGRTNHHLSVGRPLCNNRASRL